MSDRLSEEYLRGIMSGNSLPRELHHVVAKELLSLRSLESGEGKLIDERDHFEEALGEAYFRVVGVAPEWSNHFGTKEALDEIDSVIQSLTAQIPTAPPRERSEHGTDGKEGTGQ